MAITINRLEGEKAKRSHLEFMKYMWQRSDPFIIGKHTIAICDELDKAIDNYKKGISSFCMIKVPFRHGKSDIVSRYLPADFIGKFPDQEIIIAAYTASLARTFSRFARSIVRHERYRNVYPNVKLSSEEASVDVWGLQDDFGKANWLGLGGSVTGKGGSLIVIDDFFKNREEAESEVMRDKVWDAITDDVLTRCAPVCIVIILATPWHTDDPFGRIKERMENDPSFPRFKELKFPAWTGENPRKYLFTKRFSESWYKAEEAILGPYSAASLLLCEPIVRSGNLLKVDNIKIIDKCPENIPYTRGWDLASSEKQRIKENPDYTVGIKLGLQEVPSEIKGQSMPILYIDDVIRGRWEAPERNEKIKATALNDGCIEIGIEAYGPYKDTYTTISKALKGLRTVKRLQLPGDKVTKWSVLEPAFEAGNVYMRKADWNKEVINELRALPSGKHDDIADALIVAFETHNPFKKRIFPTFNIHNTKLLEIKWNEAERRPTLHYGAIVQEKDLSIWFISALWDNIAGKLFIYDSWHSEDHTPSIIAPMIIRRMRLKKYKHERILGNDRMFKEEGHILTPGQVLMREFRKHKIRVKLIEAIRYDPTGAIVSGTQMFANKQIFIDDSCEEAARQIAGWTIEKGKPSEEDCGYCIAMCMIISELRRRRKIIQEKPKSGDYGRDYVFNRDLSSSPAPMIS